MNATNFKMSMRTVAQVVVVASLAAPILAGAQAPPASGRADARLTAGALPNADRPFGTLREQAAMQQQWLKKD
jgi:hypothetical protein